jgi:hypothetical protein
LFLINKKTFTAMANFLTFVALLKAK